jgi:hypothetical protein
MLALSPAPVLSPRLPPGSAPAPVLGPRRGRTCRVRRGAGGSAVSPPLGPFSRRVCRRCRLHCRRRSCCFGLHWHKGRCTSTARPSHRCRLAACCFACRFLLSLRRCGWRCFLLGLVRGFRRHLSCRSRRRSFLLLLSCCRCRHHRCCQDCCSLSCCRRRRRRCLRLLFLCRCCRCRRRRHRSRLGSRRLRCGFCSGRFRRDRRDGRPR